MPYRPSLNFQRPKPKKEIEQPLFFDITKAFKEVSELGAELQALKQQYQEALRRLKELTDESKNGIQEKLAQINTKFISDALKVLERSSASVLARLESDFTQELTRLRNAERDVLGAIASAKLTMKGDRGESGRDGRDGFSPNISKIARDILLQIPHPKDGKDAVVNEDNIIEKIVEKLLKKGGLRIEHINGLEAQLRSISSRAALGGGGGGMGDPIHQSFSVSSSTTSITLSDTPTAQGNAIWMYYNGQFLVKGTHYNVSGKTVSLLFTPADNTTIDVTFIP